MKGDAAGKLDRRHIGHVGIGLQRWKACKKVGKAVAPFQKNRRTGPMDLGIDPRHGSKELCPDEALDHGIAPGQSLGQAACDIVAIDGKTTFGLVRCASGHPRRQSGALQAGVKGRDEITMRVQAPFPPDDRGLIAPAVPRPEEPANRADHCPIRSGWGADRRAP